jgi:hypothetical protein
MEFLLAEGQVRNPRAPGSELHRGIGWGG